MTRDDAVQWVMLDAVADQLAAFERTVRTEIPAFVQGGKPIELRDALVALRRTLTSVVPGDSGSSGELIRRAVALTGRIENLMTARYHTPAARDPGTGSQCSGLADLLTAANAELEGS